MPKIENPKNWFVKLFTLGKTFSTKTFFDNFKKHIINFMILFGSISFTLWMEKSEEIFEREFLYWDLVYGIRQDFYITLEYTKEYIEQTQWVSEMYQEQYKRWEVDNDSIYLDYKKEDDFYFAPMAYFSNRDSYNPPFTVGESFDGKDIYFNSVNPYLSSLIQDRIYGDELEYIRINTNSAEEKYINKWEERLEQWALDIEIDTDYNDFWVKNRKYIQNDKVAKYILYRRIELWSEVKEQLKWWTSILERDIEEMDSIIAIQEEKKHLLFWTY